MASAVLNLRIKPFRLLSKADAASYCSRSLKKFEGQCPVRPIEMADGDRLWDVRDLDLWIDSLKSGQGSDADEIVGRLG